MVTGTVAELLVGVVRDPAHGFVLTIAFGGILTELVADAVSMLVPSSDVEVRACLDGLRCSLLLKGYRGKPAADIDAVVAAIMGVQSFVTAMAGALEEIEINPLMCGPSGAIAADVLIRMGDDNDI
jgi:succinyl-CoA synthetase beta subunit